MFRFISKRIETFLILDHDLWKKGKKIKYPGNE